MINLYRNNINNKKDKQLSHFCNLECNIYNKIRYIQKHDMSDINTEAFKLTVIVMRYSLFGSIRLIYTRLWYTAVDRHVSSNKSRHQTQDRQS